MAATEPNPTEKPGQSHWDHEVDLLVVGSGAGVSRPPSPAPRRVWTLC